MANVARVEAVITAQDKLRPGLVSAAKALEKFRQQQAKATPLMAAQRMLDHQAALLRRGAQIAAGYVGAQKVKESVVRFADVDRQMRRAAITGDATEGRIGSATADVRDIALRTAQPIQKVQEGLDSLTASGMEFEQAMRSLPTVAKVAQATGAEVRDIATTTSAATDNFGITARELEQTYDLLAKGGKLGKFELKDMARYLPSILPAAKAVGMAGTEGMAKLVAMLQTIRIGTGSAEEAAASAQNIFQKMESEQTAKNFKKFGVDLRKEMDAARKGGKDLTEVFTDLSAKALKGDLSKIPQLFQDMELARGMRALLDNREKLKEFAAAMRAAGGTIDGDFNRVVKDAQATVDKLAESADRAKAGLGGFIMAMGGAKLAATGASSLQAIGNHAEKAAEAAKTGGASAGAAAFFDPVLQPFRDAAEERARLDREFDVGRGRIGMDKADARAALAARARGYRSERMAQAASEQRAARDQFTAAVGRNQFDQDGVIAPIAPGETSAELTRLREQADEMRREAARASGSGRGRAGGVPLPPMRPADLNGGGAFDVAPLEEVKAKAEEVKQTVGQIGPTGAQGASQLGASFASEFANIEAQALSTAARVNQALSTIRAPNIGAGLGGLPVGRSMNEVR